MRENRSFGGKGSPVLLGLTALLISLKPGFIGLCERTLTALTKRLHALTPVSQIKDPSGRTSSRMIRRAGAEGNRPNAQAWTLGDDTLEAIFH